MNKLIIFNLIISLFLCLDYVQSLPPGVPKEKIEAFRDLIKCTHDNCEEQHSALRVLFKDELDNCLKKCNYLDKNLKGLSDEERMKLRQCFRENNCKMPMEHIRAHRDTPQFKAMKKCAEEKCTEKFNKLKSIDGDKF